MSNKKKKIKLGVTLGDINGIGLEVIIKTFKDNRINEFCTPVIFGSNKLLSKYKKILEISDFNYNVANSIKDLNFKKVNLLNLWKEDIDINIGCSNKEAGKYALNSIKSAVDALKNNEIDVLVTSPINKHSIKESEKKFIGHTEYFENNFDGNALMIMVSKSMKISFVTGHIPLSKVNTIISKEAIINTAKIFNTSLIQDFRIRKPKIAVLGLNPHAGENGMLVTEENEVILPSIKKLKEEGLIIFGPYAADSFFTKKNLKAFDGIISMYHDQGLIPFKALSFEEGVNYTAGLNIIRTSPVHGTAYEISGKNKANEDSFREAVFLACDIYHKRKEFKQLNENSLDN